MANGFSPTTIERANLSAAAALENFGQVRAASRCGQRRVPGLCQLVAHGLIVEGGQAGQELRGHAHVDRTLLVGFFGHGVDTAAGSSELAGDPGQVD